MGGEGIDRRMYKVAETGGRLLSHASDCRNIEVGGGQLRTTPPFFCGEGEGNPPPYCEHIGVGMR